GPIDDPGSPVPVTPSPAAYSLPPAATRPKDADQG
ncbi:Tat pathway signal sequence domain protein, partial [Streptomyces phyllanthi]|nr:Tat pathway signal sequence domain protein [Streptomyces phyllanthi]